MKKTIPAKDHLVKNNAGYDIEIAKTRDFYIVDKDGNRYIDFNMGWCVGNLGWAHKKIRRAVSSYNGPDYVYPGLTYRPWEQLATLLCESAPGDLDKCYRTTGGSESVDAALQIAMAYTGRRKLMSLEDSYHGNTIAALSVGASETKGSIPHLLSGCEKIESPLDEQSLPKVETRLKKKDIAAFIMEPVGCNLAVHIPSVEFMQGLRKLCDRYGTLLILDEVACGFGRTGKRFASEHFGISPDILCVSKAISGGYGPLGAVLTTTQIYKKVKDKVSIYSTYGWHPVSTAATLAYLQYFLKHEEDILENVNTRSQQFRTLLSQMNWKKGGRLNMTGLAIAVDVEDKKYAEQIRKKCQVNGLFFTTQEQHLLMFPALTIDSKTVNKAMNILEEAC